MTKGGGSFGRKMGESTPMKPSKDHPSSFSGLAAIGLVIIVAFAGLALMVGNGLTGAASTQTDISTPEGMFSLLKQGSESVNTFHEKIPQAFITLFGNERIQAHVLLSSGKTLDLGVVTENGYINDITKGIIENPTLKASTTEATVRKIMISQSPVDSITQSLHSHEITYEAQTFTGSVKYGGVSLVSRILSWFHWGST